MEEVDTHPDQGIVFAVCHMVFCNCLFSPSPQGSGLTGSPGLVVSHGRANFNILV
jgi:hypothetical protein